MSPDMLASPAHVIRGLSYQIAYARDRVLQGDWTEKYAIGRIKVCAAVAEEKNKDDAPPPPPENATTVKLALEAAEKELDALSTKLDEALKLRKGPRPGW